MLDYDTHQQPVSGGRLSKNQYVAMNAFKMAAIDGDVDALWLIAKYVPVCLSVSLSVSMCV